MRLAPRWDEVTTTETVIRSGGSATLRFFVYSEQNEAQADIRNMVIANAPQIWDKWLMDSVTVEGRISDNPGDYIWAVIVEYVNPDSEYQRNEQSLPTTEDIPPGKPDDPDGPASEVVLEIRTGSGGTQQMLLSDVLVEEVAKNNNYLFANSQAKNVMGLKAADPNDKATLAFEGYPIQYGITEVVNHLWRSNKTVKNGWLLRVAEAATDNVVNLTKYLIFPAKTLRFTNFQAVQTMGGKDAGWRITLSFIYNKNKDKDKINAELARTGFETGLANNPGGHEILDYLSMPNLIPTKNIVLSTPQRLAVHKVYPEVNYRDLFKP